jgi:hypothetical protein
MVAIAPRSAMVTPLTKIRKSDGRVYERPVEIECALEHLDLLPRTEILGRLAIRDRTSPDYLPSECLVYLIRNTRTDNNAAYFDVLYGELLRRIVRALPKVEERAADGRDGVSVSREQIRDEVRGRFENWLVEDRANRLCGRQDAGARLAPSWVGDNSTPSQNGRGVDGLLGGRRQGVRRPAFATFF